MRRQLFLPALLALTAAPPLAAATSGPGYRLSVLTGGAERPEYAARGTVYVEAVRGSNYALRITNPLPVRIGVALSVDGLNTIDAGHTDASSARKWVLAPYQSVVIEGWQISGETARRFFFTGEASSYGAKLGETRNLGVIEAVFFREKCRRQPVSRGAEASGAPSQRSEAAEKRAGAPAPRKDQAAALSDDYAATGMGGDTRHAVTEVALDLEPVPVATLRIRYEFRDGLVRLGVLPEGPEPLQRREASRGFDSWCPVR
ncbi:MAG: hypothetical protein ACM3JH_14660 [Acidithiobacillales bacterium]